MYTVLHWMASCKYWLYDNQSNQAYSCAVLRWQHSKPESIYTNNHSQLCSLHLEMYLFHNTISGVSKQHGNTAALAIDRIYSAKPLRCWKVLWKHYQWIKKKKKKSQTYNLNKTLSGAKPTSYSFPSPAAVYLNDFNLQSVRKWLEQNEVSFSTLVQYHFSPPETVLRFKTISSFGLITSVISFKEIHSNSDMYLKRSPFYWGWNIYIKCLISLFISIFWLQANLSLWTTKI